MDLIAAQTTVKYPGQNENRFVAVTVSDNQEYILEPDESEATVVSVSNNCNRTSAVIVCKDLEPILVLATFEASAPTTTKNLEVILAAVFATSEATAAMIGRVYSMLYLMNLNILQLLYVAPVTHLLQ